MASSSSSGVMAPSSALYSLEQQKEGEGTSKAFAYDDIKSNSPVYDQEIKKIVFTVNLSSRIKRYWMRKALSRVQGIKLIDYDNKERKLTVIGDVDYVTLGARLRKIAHTDLVSVGPASERLAKEHDKPGYNSGEEDKPGYESDGRITNSTIGESGNQYSTSSAYQCRLFSFAEIKSATKSFNGKWVLRESGTTYKGQISSKEAGYVVAIKRYANFLTDIELRHEIDTLCKFRHRHLVSLIGYCYDNKEKILVYEYMPNGSLYHHLHEAHTPLSWVARLKIAIGAARGLAYLHTSDGTRHGVIHRNVKSSNILLDENWEAVISGLGMSIIGPTDQSISYVQDVVRGTMGYIDPLNLSTGRFTWKSDVYSFGVVLFEMLSARIAFKINFNDEEGSPFLAEWAKICVENSNIDKMVDSNIKGTISTECLERFAQIAESCLRNDPSERPTMNELLTSLQALLELQENSNLSAESSNVIDQTGTSSQQE